MHRRTRARLLRSAWGLALVVAIAGAPVPGSAQSRVMVVRSMGRPSASLAELMSAATEAIASCPAGPIVRVELSIDADGHVHTDRAAARLGTGDPVADRLRACVLRALDGGLSVPSGPRAVVGVAVGSRADLATAYPGRRAIARVRLTRWSVAGSLASRAILDALSSRTDELTAAYTSARSGDGEDLSGRIVLAFTVAADGTVVAPSVTRGIDEALDAAFLTVVRRCQFPAAAGATTVELRYTLDVVRRRRARPDRSPAWH